MTPKKLKFTDLKRQTQFEKIEQILYKKEGFSWHRKFWTYKVNENVRISIFAATAMICPSTNLNVHVFGFAVGKEDTIEWSIEAITFIKGGTDKYSRKYVNFGASRKEFNKAILDAANDVLEQLTEKPKTLQKPLPPAK